MNLTKLLIDFLGLAEFLRFLNLAKFLIVLPPPLLSILLSLSTSTFKVKLFDNPVMELVQSIQVSRVKILLM